MPSRRRTTEIKEFIISLPPDIAIIQGRFKVEIEDQAGNVTTITEGIEDPLVTDLAIDEGMSHANLVLQNPIGKYINTDGALMWNGGEELRIFQDYATDAASLTTSHLLFRGKMHAPLRNMVNGEHTLFIEARKLPELKDRKRVIVFPEGTTFYDAANKILSDYTDLIDLTDFASALSGVTDTFARSFDDSDANILNWIFSRAGWSGYFDNDDDDDGKYKLTAFVDDGNEKNEDVFANYGQTLLRVSDVGVRTGELFTRVRVVGNSVGGASVIREKKDSDEEDDLWRRDLKISSNTVNSMAEGEKRAELELTKATAKPVKGNVLLFGDRRLKPGQYFRVFSNYDGLNAWFKVSRVTHFLGLNYLMSVQISNKLRENQIDKIISLSDKVNDLASFDNPNDMKFTYNFPFDDNSLFAQDEGLEYVNGVMRVQSPATSGSFTSKLLTVPENVSQGDFKLEGPSNMEDSRIWLSANRGDDEIEFDISQENFTLPLVAGDKLQVRMEINGATASASGLVARFK